MTAIEPVAKTEVLAGKRILIISPQPWDHIFISKHHYAEELAARNTVYFLEPPLNHKPAKPVIRPASGGSGVQLVSWRPGFPRNWRFHAYPVYRRLIAGTARRISRLIGGAPDIVWCFDFNLFPDLRAFGAPIVIFHPVDPLSDTRQVDIGDSADLIISVSERILGNFNDRRFSGKTLLINHGLAPSFRALCEKPVPKRSDGALHVGYVGNLDRPIINVKLLKQLVVDHTEIMFHFWGPHSQQGPVFKTLGDLENTRFHGSLKKDRLADAIAPMDCLLLPYKRDKRESDLSNSHKLLEYMSTGKVTVASRMDCYTDDDRLVKMPINDSDEEFADLFRETVQSIDAQNTDDHVSYRKSFASTFTYSENVAMIDQRLATQISAKKGS